MRKSRKILLVIEIVLAVACAVALAKLPNEGLIDINFAGHSSVVNLKGIITSFQSLLFISMTCLNNKVGSKIAYVLLGISSFGMLMGMVKTHNLVSLPGLVTNLLALISIIIITYQLKKSELDSISDYVTGLLNRKGLVRELEKKNASKRKYYMIFIHIKNLKSINDSLGYEYGDKALEIVSERINNAAGKDAIVSKLDGTEFAVALPDTVDIREKSDTIMNSIYESIDFNVFDVDAKFYLNAYAGIASFPDDAKSTIQLLKHADMAMYRASKSQEEKVIFFSKSLEDELLRRSRVEQCIKESLKNDYFYLVYQPQFESRNQKLRGFETLIRMKMPDGTCIGPGEFISIAEKTDLIVEIDDYVAKRAMLEFKNYVKLENRDITLSVNISAKEISNPGFADKFLNIVKETGFPPECLEIEITEYSLYDSLDRTIANITKLKEQGIKLALDDFGTGYTSLAQLLNLPFDLLKIDKTLVDSIEQSETSREFITLVIYMGHIMNSEVICEGVEYQKQLDILRDQECDFIQGYVWGRPLSLEDAKALASTALFLEAKGKQTF